MSDFTVNKNPFIEQICSDAREEYARAVSGEVVFWDLIVVTASNETQAESCRGRLAQLADAHRLPAGTRYEVVADPGGLRVGSGGATLNVLRLIRDRFGDSYLDGHRILLIHSGGDSRRTPQYSVCGKLFSPVPRALPGGGHSTLFDEIMISAAGIARRINEGMVVLCGDVLTLFNPLQADFRCDGALALSALTPVSVGEKHGVFVPDENGLVGSFLHKNPEPALRAAHAVSEKDEVSLDVGSVILGTRILRSLLSLISSDGVTDGAKFDAFVNDRVRLNFYGDFMYPLSSRATLEEYLTQTPEFEFSDALTLCRRAVWEALGSHSMRLAVFSPAAFIYFDSSEELLGLMTNERSGYAVLGGGRAVNTNYTRGNSTVINSLIEPSADIGDGCYIENSRIGGCVGIGEGCIISGVDIDGIRIPPHTLVSGVHLRDGRRVVRIIGIDENPKLPRRPGESRLWDEKLFPARDSFDDAARESLGIYLGTESVEDGEYFSLSSSFNRADSGAGLRNEIRLWHEIRARILLDCAVEHRGALYAREAFRDNPLREEQLNIIRNAMPLLGTFERMRLCFLLDSLGAGKQFEEESFAVLRDALVGRRQPAYRLPGAPDEVSLSLPLRVNWGGGWTDTPPYCLENGGTVLNAAVRIGGVLPARVRMTRLDEPVIVLACSDSGVSERFTDIAPLQICDSPFDSFSLHKAALMTAGVVPVSGGTFGEILERTGGGFALTTGVVNIPRGSGLGTSSILSGACLSAIYRYLGLDIDSEKVYNNVLCSEQLMNTGGGWQDQIGGMTPGIKLITSAPGIPQRFDISHPDIPARALDELKRRFCLIYTGQRRLARNHLHLVVERYMNGDPAMLDALGRIKILAGDMYKSLCAGDIDAFSALLDEHWGCSRTIDSGCSAECIDAVFDVCGPLISGRMICGAGGGGFLQVMLRPDVTSGELRERLFKAFGTDSVKIYESEFVFDSPTA